MSTKANDSNAEIRLVVGLGNPGSQYTTTRHNVGFQLTSLLERQLGIQFQAEKKFFGQVAHLNAQNTQNPSNKSLWLLQPSTFMNNSGQAVQAFTHFRQIAPESILVIHDELDLEPGTIRLKQGGGHAGHNGLKDIISRLGSPDFWRLRLGIGHPRNLGLRQDVADFVLHPPRQEERTLFDNMLDNAIQAWPLILAGELSQAQRLLHNSSN